LKLASDCLSDVWKDCRCGNSARALERLVAVQQDSERPDSPEFSCDCEWLKAWIFVQAGQLDAGFDHARQARTLSTELGPAIQARTEALYGWALSDLGLQDESFNCAARAVELAEASGDTWSLAFALYVQAVTVELGGDTETALDITERSAELAQSIGDNHLLSWILFGHGYQIANLADANEDIGSRQEFIQGYERAINLTLQAQALALANGDTLTARRTMVNCADLYSHIERFADAHAQLDSWRGVKGTPTAKEHRQYLANVAETLLHEGKPVQARDYCRQALELAGQAEDLGQIAQYSKLLAEIEEQNGDFKEALRLHKDFYAREKKYQGEAIKRRARVAAIHYETKKLHKQVEEVRAMMLLTEHEALTDQLTGIANRRGLHNALETTARDNAVNYALVYADIDHFKSINDQFSHQTGDMVIKAFADILVTACRTSDVVARHGGEEFVILLKRASAEHAVIVCNRIMDSLHQHDWSTVAPGLSVTASFGVAMGFESADWNSVLALADARLYLAKTGGRDRFVTAGGIS